MNSKSKNLILPLIITIISGLNFNCKSKLPADGGPCSYDTKEFPARLLSFDMVSDSSADLTLEIYPYGEDRKDTISYYITGRSYISLHELSEKNIHVGDSLVYEVKEIIDGACNPYIVGVKLEKFKTK